MKTILLLIAASACYAPAYGASIYAPGQSELAIYQFDGSVSGAFAPDWSGWAADYNQQIFANPGIQFPLFGIYPCFPVGCPDFTGVRLAPYGPAVQHHEGNSETPEPATWSLLLGAIGCFGIAKVARRKA